PQPHDGALQLGVEVHQLEEHDPADRTSVHAERHGRHTRLRGAGVIGPPNGYFRAPSMSPRIVLFLTIFIDLMGFGLVIPILPNWISELMGSEVWVGFAIAMFSIMQF